MHLTNEQDVVAAKEKLSGLKESYMDTVRNYISHAGATSASNCLDELLACQQAGAAYFNYAEEFVGNSNLLGAHQSALWAQGFAEDCAEMLKSLPGHFQLLSDGFARINPLPMPAHLIRPGATAYANMQRMVAKYLTSGECKSIRSLLESAGLPVYGFSNEAREFMSKKAQALVVFVFGVIFVSVLLIISFVQPNPSSFQYVVFKTVLVLAGTGIAAMLPGFIDVKFGNWLRAGGALAVFALLYFFNPAAQPPIPVATDGHGAVVGTTSSQANVGPNGVIINNSGPGIQQNSIGTAGR